MQITRNFRPGNRRTSTRLTRVISPPLGALSATIATLREVLQTHLAVAAHQQRRSYVGAAVVVLEGPDGRLSLQHEGRIIASQEAPPSPASLRSRNETSSADSIPAPDPELGSKPWVKAIELQRSKPDQEEDAHAAAINAPDAAGSQVVASPQEPTFLQHDRWNAVQQAKLKGISIRRMARELGIHRDRVRRYIHAKNPRTRRSQIASTVSPSDSIADQTGDISAGHLNGHYPEHRPPEVRQSAPPPPFTLCIIISRGGNLNLEAAPHRSQRLLHLAHVGPVVRVS